MKCKFCDYEWQNRKEVPVSCPRCRKRFDYPFKELETYRERINITNENPFDAIINDSKVNLNKKSMPKELIRHRKSMVL